MSEYTSASSELVYMNAERVERTLKRMAYQVAESNRRNQKVVLFGIEDRGYLVARQLNEFLEDIYGSRFPLLRVRDEIDLVEHPDVSKSELRDAYLLIVDDVIFTGQTMFNALNTVYDVIQFNEIHTAVLVDRGHRTFPVQAQFVGLELSTKLKEHVSVIAEENKIQRVVLEIS